MFCSLLSVEESVGRDPSDQEGKVSELSFDELYALYATDVLRVSYYYLGDRQRAEDVTQDVFIRYLQNRPALVSGREKSWLLKVALNRCRDLWRSSWLKKVVLGHPAFELFPADDEIGRAAKMWSSSIITRATASLKSPKCLELPRERYPPVSQGPEAGCQKN